MVYKLLGALVCLVVIALITVAIGLGVLQYNKTAFADYWQGRSNQPGDFIFVVIGDSAAQSLGASKPENGYVSLLAGRIEQTTGRSVRILNFSQSGATVDDALHKQAARLNSIQADLVLVEVGANDMKQYDKNIFSAKYRQLLQTLPPGRGIVANVPYFGMRPDLNDATSDANRIIDSYARSYGVPVADLFSRLQENQSPLIYASDFFHPNNRGYRLWYDALRPVVEDRLEHLDNLAE
jgi:lysophospholipase L1-like esterase